MEIVYTGDTTGGYTRLTGKERVTFEPDGTADVSPERASRLVEMYDNVEFGERVPRRYQELQKLAAAADTDEISGNSGKEEIYEYLAALDPEELDELKRRV